MDSVTSWMKVGGQCRQLDEGGWTVSPVGLRWVDSVTSWMKVGGQCHQLDEGGWTVSPVG